MTITYSTLANWMFETPRTFYDKTLKYDHPLRLNKFSELYSHVCILVFAYGPSTLPFLYISGALSSGDTLQWRSLLVDGVGDVNKIAWANAFDGNNFNVSATLALRIKVKYSNALWKHF